MFDNLIINLENSINLSLNMPYSWSLPQLQDTIFYLNTNQWNSYIIKDWINTFVSNLFLSYIYLLNFKELFSLNLNLPIIQHTQQWSALLFSQTLQYYTTTEIYNELIMLEKNLFIKNLSYNFIIFWTFFKLSITLYLIYYVLVYNYFNINQLNNLQNSFLAKLLHSVDSEEELGSIDDAFILILLFLIVLGWFFCLSISYSYLFHSQLTVFGLGAIILVGFILLTPLSALLDFGIAFTSYIRGASSSANLLVECIFDIIGTLVVFTRFIVQNIRFVLIFFAYFELFEWTYNSLLIQTLLQTINVNIQTTWNMLINLGFIESNNLFTILSICLTTIISYLYYLVHLLILIFVQTTIYLLISFWLFFFFYTSFTLNKSEKLFIYKKID